MVLYCQCVQWSDYISAKYLCWNSRISNVHTPRQSLMHLGKFARQCQQLPENNSHNTHGLFIIPHNYPTFQHTMHTNKPTCIIVTVKMSIVTVSSLCHPTSAVHINYKYTCDEHQVKDRWHNIVHLGLNAKCKNARNRKKNLDIVLSICWVSSQCLYLQNFSNLYFQLILPSD